MFKNKKADLQPLVKILLWVLFFAIALVAAYFLIKKLTGGV